MNRSFYGHKMLRCSLPIAVLLIFCVHVCNCDKDNDKCSSIRCGYFSKCAKVNGTAKCICDIKCDDWMAPVCGSNGVTYGNQCLMRMNSCLTQRLITIRHVGSCHSEDETCHSLPPPPQHSKYIKDNAGNYHIHCLHGYYRQGDARVKCRNGKWEVFAACHKKTCAHPGDIDNGKVTMGQFHFGAKVSYSCQACYTLDGPKERVCLGNESWSGEKPTCKPVDCGDLVDDWEIENGIVFGQDTLCGSTIEFECFEGFTLIGSQTVICQSNGKWSARKPECRAMTSGAIESASTVQCVGVNSPANGRIENAMFNEVYKPGHELMFECFRQYELIGSPVLTCMGNGSWSSSVPVCQLAYCDDAEAQAPKGGSRYGGNYIGETRSFFCDKDRKLIGPPIILCTEKGKWSKKPPICKSYCDDVTCKDGEKCIYERSRKRVTCACVPPSECQAESSSDKVCGSDGVTYDSICHLQSFECFKGKKINVTKTGPCSTDQPTDEISKVEKHKSIIQCPQCRNQTDICNKIAASDFTLFGKKVMEDEFSYVLSIKRVLKDTKNIAKAKKIAKIFKMTSGADCYCFPEGMKGDILATGNYITSEGNDIILVSSEDDFVGRFYGMKQIKNCI